MSRSGQRPRRAELLALGQAVRRRRDEAGLTLDGLASASGVSRGMLVAVEHGTRNPGVVSLFEIAAALGINASTLMAEAEVDVTSD